MKKLFLIFLVLFSISVIAEDDPCTKSLTILIDSVLKIEQNKLGLLSPTLNEIQLPNLENAKKEVSTHCRDRYKFCTKKEIDSYIDKLIIEIRDNVSQAFKVSKAEEENKRAKAHYEFFKVNAHLYKDPIAVLEAAQKHMDSAAEYENASKKYLDDSLKIIELLVNQIHNCRL